MSRLIVKAAIFFPPLLIATFGYSHESNHEAPWEVCEDSQKSAQCSYTNGEGDLFRGTCQSFSEALMCVRNEPIIYAVDLGRNSSVHSHDNESVDDHN